MVSLQGIISEYEHHYYAGIDFSTMLRYTTLKDILVPTGFLVVVVHLSGEQNLKRLFSSWRSMWKAVLFGIVFLPVILILNWSIILSTTNSCTFYSEKWSVDRMERHSVLVHQAHYPIKGLHFVFEALGKLKRNIRILNYMLQARIFFILKGLAEDLCLVDMLNI